MIKSFQIQYRYAPNTDAFLILIQIQLFRYSSNTLQTRMPFWYSFRFNFLDTVQIFSRYGFHSDTHWDSSFRNSSNMLQIRKPFWCSFRYNFQIQFRYAPDTDAILILIQVQLLDTVQIRPRHGCYFDTHSDSTFKYSSDTLQTRMPFW